VLNACLTFAGLFLTVTSGHPLIKADTATVQGTAQLDGKGVAREAVVYLEGEFPTGGISAIMEQKDRRFVPELLVVPVGSTVSFPNLDQIFHNVFSLSKPKSFDLGNYPKDQTRTVTFTKPGVEFVNCHLHPNMSAAIVVTPNKWRATADRAGHFVLRDVPAGPYTVVAWHKAVGYFKQVVKVIPNRGASVEFFVPLDDAIARVEARR